MGALQSSREDWKNGFDLARPVAHAGYLFWTYCLKTHRGAESQHGTETRGRGDKQKRAARDARRSEDVHERYDCRNPSCITPKFIVMDTVAVARLKHHVSNEEIMSKKLFEQEQIARAVEMGLGVKSHDQIEIVTTDAASRDYGDRLKQILSRG
jgi:uncharacterized protein (DUF362 family)